MKYSRGVKKTGCAGWLGCLHLCIVNVPAFGRLCQCAGLSGPSLITYVMPNAAFTKVSQTLQDSRSGGLEKSA